MANGPKLLKLWRKEKGLTQPEAAERLKVSFRMYCRYELDDYGTMPIFRAQDIARRTNQLVPADSWQ